MKLKVLGSGQDGGIPHLGCNCAICKRAKKDKKFQRLGPSIAIFDKDIGFSYLIDASPDFKQQLNMIYSEIKNVKRKGKLPIDGVLLTHAHLGHYVGLLQLGKETIDEKNLPVYCTRKMHKFLKDNLPFRFLLQRGNIKINEITSEKEFKFQNFNCLPIKIPHRNEIADTVGFIIYATKKVIYIPDIDYWTASIIEEIKTSDIALIDGTFYSEKEIARYSDVPHPPIRETIKIFNDAKTRIYFTHINHTNVINENGKERKHLENKGFKITYDGLVVKI